MKSAIHSSDYELLIAHEDANPLPILKFNLKVWEISDLSNPQLILYQRCVTHQLNIRINVIRCSVLGSTKVEIPTFDKGVQIYDASLKEMLAPHTIISNYHKFLKQFDATEFGRYMPNFTRYKHEIENAQCLVDVLMTAESVYKCLMQMFNNKEMFDELYNHEHYRSMYYAAEIMFGLWDTGLCYVVNDVRNVDIQVEFKELLSNHCSENEYFKDNEGFMSHYSPQGIDLPRCIEACEVRLELINLLKTDLENIEED